MFDPPPPQNSSHTAQSAQANSSGYFTAALGPNERKVMRHLRTNPRTPRHLLTDVVGVTPQAIGQIVTRLTARGLLIEHEAVKDGKHGQPPRPLSINASATFSLGIKIGRRHTDVVLTNLVGVVTARKTIVYVKPIADDLLPKIRDHIGQFQQELAAQNQNLIGIGLAAPLTLGGWQSMLDLTAHESLHWQALDLLEAVQEMTSVPVHMVKDTAAACMAELLDGHGTVHHNFLYIFVDTFVGGAIVNGRQLMPTARGNAGAFASLPLCAVPLESYDLRSKQLVSLASLWELEQRFRQEGLNPHMAYEAQALDKTHGPYTAQWLRLASHSLAYCIVSGAAFCDADSVVIDGSMSDALLQSLVHKTKESLTLFNWEGLWCPNVLQGTVGADAGAIGGALLPLFNNFYA